ncbi:hypothetical protein JCM10908_001564 [Rhodotorula pacifica]|uniref:uncharacterized protein n=1 Tax=Rhodotorula pacifica TaxID=1495444 RepID=UPI00317F6F09
MHANVPASPFLSSASPARRGSAFTPYSPSLGKGGADAHDSYAVQASAATPRLGTQFASNRGRKSEAPPVALPIPAGLRWTDSKGHSRRPSAISRLQTAMDPRAVVMTPGRLAGLVVLIFLAGYISSFLPSIYADSPASSPSLRVKSEITMPVHTADEDEEVQRRYYGKGQAGSVQAQAAANLESGWRKAAAEAGNTKPNRRQGPARMRYEDVDELSGAHEYPQPRARYVQEPEPKRPDPHASKPRDKQFQRLKKMAAAKAQDARVGEAAPADIAARQAAARNEQDRVITEGGAGKQRRLRKPSGSLAEFAAEVAAEKEQAEGNRARQEYDAYGDPIPPRRRLRPQQEYDLHEELEQELDA